MSNIIKEVKPQAKRISPKLKSQILDEILSSDNVSIPTIAKKYDLSSTTLYGWRIDYVKKVTKNLSSNNQELPKNNNFIELLPKEEISSISQKEDLTLKTSKLKSLSEISLTFNNDILLSLKGNINIVTLTKILNLLEEELC